MVDSTASLVAVLMGALAVTLYALSVVAAWAVLAGLVVALGGWAFRRRRGGRP